MHYAAALLFKKINAIAAHESICYFSWTCTINPIKGAVPAETWLTTVTLNHCWFEQTHPCRRAAVYVTITILSFSIQKRITVNILVDTRH